MNPAAVCLKASAMLRRLQWNDDNECWTCGNALDWGHEPDCALADLIDELDAVEGTAAKIQRKENACGNL